MPSTKRSRTAEGRLRLTLAAEWRNQPDHASHSNGHHRAYPLDVTHSEITEEWPGAYARMLAEWDDVPQAHVASIDLALWDQRFAAMVGQEQLLRAAGEWVSGPSDLLHILGLAALELRHSRIVAWLLDPTARHRLGASLLTAIFQAGWPTLDVPPVGRAVIREEVVIGHRRADIVVRAGGTTLVIENKIWAAESTNQAEDLYQLWSGDGDVRYLFLTLDGRPPREVRSAEAAAAWRRLSYRAMAEWLSEQVLNMPHSTARGSVEQYAATLLLLVPGHEPFAVGAASGGMIDG